MARMAVGTTALGALLVAAILYAQTPARGFDLQDSPAVINRPGADLPDVYLFPSPTNANDVVAVMDVHPLIPAGAGLTTFFDNKVLYQMKFDNTYATESTTGRPKETTVIQFSVGPPGSGTQTIYVYGPGTPGMTGTTNKLLNSGAASGVGAINRPFQSTGGLTVFAGTRADPFFFDLAQFYNIFPNRNQGSTAPSCLPSIGNGSCPQGFNNPGTDFFADTNTLSIVVELPKSDLIPSGTGPIVAYWATTSTESGN